MRKQTKNSIQIGKSPRNLLQHWRFEIISFTHSVYVWKLNFKFFLNKNLIFQFFSLPPVFWVGSQAFGWQKIIFPWQWIMRMTRRKVSKWSEESRITRFPLVSNDGWMTMTTTTNNDSCFTFLKQILSYSYKMTIIKMDGSCSHQFG